MLKIAFVGFRHPHIMSVYNRAVADTDEWCVTGACEEDENACRQLAAEGKVKVTHTDYAAMLDSVECDLVAVGDYYTKRGRLIIEALQRGKHVVSDKPICTDLDELRKIKDLSAEKNLKVGCQLDVRAIGTFRRLREVVRSGGIGEVLSVSVTGQHPLGLGTTRPGWYFEEGKHGGTINDIGIHAFDFIPWITGLDFAEVVAARVWNAMAQQFPHFQTGAQFMLRMSNNAGVMGDMSYFKPEQFGGQLPQYWRTTIFGSEGVLETSSSAPVTLARNGSRELETMPPLDLPPDMNLMRSLALEIGGATDNLIVSTAEVLQSARVSLQVQQAADKNLAGVAL